MARSADSAEEARDEQPILCLICGFYRRKRSEQHKLHYYMKHNISHSIAEQMILNSTALTGLDPPPQKKTHSTQTEGELPSVFCVQAGGR